MFSRPYCSLSSSDHVIQAKRAEVEAEVAKLEAELEARGNVDTLTARKDELKVQIRAGQTRLTQLRNDEKQINESLAGVNNTIAELEKQIAEHNLVISLMPYIYINVIQAVIKGKTNVMTTSYISTGIPKLKDDIKKAGIAIINEIGLEPGVDHLYAIKTIDEVHSKGGKVGYRMSRRAAYG